MGTLTVWKFDTAEGAEKATGILKDMAAQRLLTIHDAATVRWEEGKKKPQTKQLNNLAGAGALGGAFWGMLFGLIFFVPLLGAAIGAASGALAGSLSDVGIDDKFINRLREEGHPRHVRLVHHDLRRRGRPGARGVRRLEPRADLHQPQRRAGARHP